MSKIRRNKKRRRFICRNIWGVSYNANKKAGITKIFTPHHAIQNATAKASRSRGATINIKKSIHKLTYTYRNPKVRIGTPRQQLAADIFELRRLLKDAGYDKKIVNQQLRKLIQLNKEVGNI